MEKLMMWSIRHHQAARLVRRSVLCVGLLALISGCGWLKHMLGGSAENTSGSMQQTVFMDVLEASYAAADFFTKELSQKSIRITGGILTASLVNVNNLEESCPLGRIISEQISSRMAQNGYKLIDMKLRANSIYIKEEKGEFLLSRKIQEISKTQNSDYVIVGTYAVAEKSVYISTRIVDTNDNSIITGYDYQLGRNYQTESLLKN